MAEEKPNFYFYSTPALQAATAGKLIMFGYERFKGAKLIYDLPLLRTIAQQSNLSFKEYRHLGIPDFAFEYLMDCVRIVFFFENYMKGELVARGYCVHKIDKDKEKFKALYKEQFKRPVSLSEIQAIEPFVSDKQKETYCHPALKKTTIGMSELTENEAYTKCYDFDADFLAAIKDFNTKRNELHFNTEMEFEVSQDLVKTIELFDSFANYIVTNRLKKRQAPAKPSE